MAAYFTTSLDRAISAVIGRASQALQPSATALLEAELLLAHALGAARVYLHTWPQRELTETQLSQFHALLTRRAAGEPLAYITGQREFWSMQLQVTPDTLIPRPETELLVELALQRIARDADGRIADLGTGSGAIALAVARERPRCTIVASDISPAALVVAQENARCLNIHNVEFRRGDDSGAWDSALHGEHFDMIVSNPPYISSDDPHLTAGDLRFEPHLALEAGTDGMQHLRAIAAVGRSRLMPGGWLLLEHGYDQGFALAQLLTAMGYQDVQGHRDLAGHNRIITARFVEDETLHG